MYPGQREELNKCETIMEINDLKLIMCIIARDDT